MADALANELLKVLVKKMTDEAFKRVARAHGIYNELKELKKTLCRIQDLLNDASQKEATHKSVKEWLNGLQNLAYDIDDVLDDLATEDMHRELTLQEPAASTSMVRKLFPSCCTNFSLSHRLSPKLDSINRELENLEKRKTDLGLLKIDEKPRNTSRRSETSLPERDVVGREVEKEQLLKKLLGDGGSSQDNFSILPIVGMGGVGKTTLARLLYNDTKVKDHFELMAWSVTTTENKKFEDLDKLQKAIVEQFKGKRFLLVVDDVWSENYGDWEYLGRPFLSCAPGSRIIMTTRKERLLKELGFENLDCLQSLSHGDALCLLALHAFGVDNFDLHITLKPQGEGIVRKCARLPLALKAIGRLLRTRSDKEDWDDVLNSEIWDIETGNDIENGNDKENRDKILPALKLSYHDLPADLKQLFAYCSLFPKDFLFDKEDLVLLWMAEGFLNPSNATKSPERLGREYFEILLSRSFFQHAPNNESLFIMHDLMNDLAIFVAGEFFLRFDNQVKTKTEDLAKYRHMSFTREEYGGYHKFEAFKESKRLRTLLAVSVGLVQRRDAFYLSNKIFVDLLPELKLLKVLSLSHFEITEVPEFINSLKHLRYLNLSKTMIKELPENVSNLYNLQTLIVFGCENLSKLPKSFLKLKRLRHFDIRNTPLLEKLPFGIGELESLQTLTKIIIEEGVGFAINELKGLTNLHGEVSIEGLHKVQCAKHAQEGNLSLKKITRLELQWVNEFDGSRIGTHENDVLNELKPNSDTLKELSMVSYGGTQFSNWVGDPAFHKLVYVSIRGCSLYVSNCYSIKRLCCPNSIESLEIDGCSVTDVYLPKEGGNKLKSLRIRNCDKLEGKINNTSMPMLETLYIRAWVNLRSISELSNSAHLTSLDIMRCPHIVSLPELQLSNLTRLEIFKCESLESLPELSNITFLSIIGCERLVSLPELKNLALLKDLKMKRCPGIDVSIHWPPKLCSLEVGGLKKPISEWGDLNFPPSLVELKLWCERDVRNFSQLSHLFPSSLTSLEINQFDNLESVSTGLQHLTSLQHLEIWKCPKVNDLPETLLPSFLSLTIYSCPKLEERCAGRGSHYWPLISHIPCIYMDGRTL
ncbi:putative virus X resistance protein-like, coiled-coil [Helianthus annuus]|nr:putative virus X resistance protein-like, coiled-coil [Helianthus annuus]